MLFTMFLRDYLRWHYSEAFGEIHHVFRNLRWFVISFFSLGPLTHSLFAPWKRMTEDRGAGFNFEDIAGTIIINVLSRVIGFVLRSTIILSGLTSLMVLIVANMLTFVFWVCAPLILLLGLVAGLTLIFV